MDAVDGNAIGGLLIDVFGTEMTAASSTCATCGASRPVAELVVYRRAPGTVVRCRTCGSVVMVMVRRTDVISVDLSGLASGVGCRTFTGGTGSGTHMPVSGQESVLNAFEGVNNVILTAGRQFLEATWSRLDCL
jgi:DNA-directed RNA polymerase subunit RPC12/RpoP